MSRTTAAAGIVLYVEEGGREVGRSGPEKIKKGRGACLILSRARTWGGGQGGDVD